MWALKPTVVNKKSTDAPEKSEQKQIHDVHTAYIRKYNKYITQLMNERKRHEMPQTVCQDTTKV